MMQQQRYNRWKEKIPQDDFQEWNNGGEIKFDNLNTSSYRLIGSLAYSTNPKEG